MICKTCKHEYRHSRTTGGDFFCRRTRKCAKANSRREKKADRFWPLHGWCEIACEWCEQEFVTTREHVAKYCSEECQLEAANDRHSGRYTKIERATAACDCCGDDFEQARSDAKYCSPRCRVAGNRAKAAKTKSTKKRRIPKTRKAK